jgi:hypothetical protein
MEFFMGITFNADEILEMAIRIEANRQEKQLIKAGCIFPPLFYSIKTIGIIMF